MTTELGATMCTWLKYSQDFKFKISKKKKKETFVPNRDRFLVEIWTHSLFSFFICYQIYTKTVNIKMKKNKKKTLRLKIIQIQI